MHANMEVFWHSETQLFPLSWQISLKSTKQYQDVQFELVYQRNKFHPILLNSVTSKVKVTECGLKC